MNEDALPKLPKGWVWTNVGGISELLRGVSYPKEESSKEAKDDYIPILRANNINIELNFKELVYVPQKRVEDEQFVKAFDILIAMSSGSKDLVGKASQSTKDYHMAFGTFCGLVRPIPNINQRFVGFFFQSPDYRNGISRLSSGVNINNLRREHIESMPIPFPPFTEQHRIVTKIEELFTKLDAGLDALTKAKNQIKRYRQAVLKSAFEGRLTEEWRKANKDKLKPASVLLERLKEERKKKLGRKCKELPPMDTSELPELPEGWAWTRLGDIVSVRSGEGLSSYKMVSEGNYPVYGGNGISGYHNQFMFKESELIIGRVGAKCGVIHITQPRSWVTDNALIVDFSHIEIKFLYYALGLIDLNKYSVSTAQPVISGSKIYPILFKLPPLSEQHRIVEEIEHRLSIAEETEKTIDQSLKQSEQLRQSILKTAFEGKLVPQDPTDLPAAELLKQIKKEREASETFGKKKKTRKEFKK